MLKQPVPLLSSVAGLTIDGKSVAAPLAPRLYCFHKPVGCLTASNDPRGRRTIYDIFSRDLPRLMPVGRLDYNSEGLLLLTNDGDLKRWLEMPVNQVERAYRVRAFGVISQAQLDILAEGVTIEGVRYGSIIAHLDRGATRSATRSSASSRMSGRAGPRNLWLEMTLTEGKNREVRRVLGSFGLEVSRLIRVRYGDFALGSLPVKEVAPVPQSAVSGLLRRRMASTSSAGASSARTSSAGIEESR